MNDMNDFLVLYLEGTKSTFLKFNFYKLNCDKNKKIIIVNYFLSLVPSR